MPGAEETTYLIEVMPEMVQDSFTTRDVDVLVSRIKENLRLSGLKSRSSLAQKIRASPYRLPLRGESDDECGICAGQKSISAPELCCWSASGKNKCEHTAEQQRRHRRMQQRKHLYESFMRSTESDEYGQLFRDPYDCYQTLLDEGALIKEAVKRLRTHDDYDDEDASSATLDSMDEEEEEDKDELLPWRRRADGDLLRSTSTATKKTAPADDDLVRLSIEL